MKDYSAILTARSMLSSLRAQAQHGHAQFDKTPPDLYQERLRAVLRQTCEPEYPEGLILWLETAAPGLYEEVTSRLPDLIDRLWAENAPIEEFETALDEWLKAHRSACALFRSCLE